MTVLNFRPGVRGQVIARLAKYLPARLRFYYSSVEVPEDLASEIDAIIAEIDRKDLEREQANKEENSDENDGGAQPSGP
jgi:hypothetical protein